MGSLSHSAPLGASKRFVAASAVSVAAGFAGGLALLPLFADAVPSRPSEAVVSHFFQGGVVRTSLLGPGWATPVPDGTNTHGPRAEVHLSLDDGRSTDLMLRFEFLPVPAPGESTLRFDVSVNGMRLGEWSGKRSTTPLQWQVVVPRAIWNLDSPARVALAFPEPASDAPPSAKQYPGIILRTIGIRRFAY